MSDENKIVEVKREVTLEDFKPLDKELRELILERNKAEYLNKILNRVENLFTGSKNEDK
jgi:hypothetical protein